jgi:hypothetical protein
LGELKDILLNFGAIAGFAGIVGLAVLAMLYFSQARDVRRLREWAGREPERAAEVELRAQQIASQAIAQAYESMALRQSEAAAAAGIAQEEGVEVAAPLAVEEDTPEVAEGETVISDETQAHDVVAHEFDGEPSVAEGEEAAENEHVEGEEAEEGEEAPAVEHPAEVAAAANESVSSTSTPAPDETAVHPAPVEPDAEDAADEVDTPNRLAPSTPAAARAASPLPPLPPLDTSEFTAVRTPSTPPIPDYYLTSETGSGHFEPVDPPTGRSRVPFAVAGVLVAIFAVILIATQIVGGDDSSDKGNTTAKTPAAETPNTAERNQKVNRSAVTVSILNGTDTSGIAAIASDGLQKAGFSDTTVGNLNDGTVHPTSTVYYANGSKLEATEVAKEMKVSDVKPATDAVLAAGGSVPVIVVLGADFDQ